MSTKIGWTDEVWNPITGCTQVSDGCKNCYAEKMHKRLAAMGIKKYSRPFDEVVCHSNELKKPLGWEKPRMVFVNSMGDLFHKDVPFPFIDNIIDVIRWTKQHTYQILTKRPERMFDYFNNHIQTKYLMDNGNTLPNVWIGVTVENQKSADERIPLLSQTPADVRWLSIEPMLENIDLTAVFGLYQLEGGEYALKVGSRWKDSPDWVVVGCESGPKRRECKIEWIENIVNQCKAAKVLVFVKQLNINGKVVKDINGFPKHLQIRQYPINKENKITQQYNKPSKGLDNE